MKLGSLRAWATSSFEYPVSHETVIEQHGTVELEAPNPSDSETVADVLTRCNESRFETAAALSEAIRGNLSECYIGRKFYDDRGSNPRAAERDVDSF